MVDRSNARTNDGVHSVQSVQNVQRCRVCRECGAIRLVVGWVTTSLPYKFKN